MIGLPRCHGRGHPERPESPRAPPATLDPPPDASRRTPRRTGWAAGVARAITSVHSARYCRRSCTGVRSFLVRRMTSKASSISFGSARRRRNDGR